VIKQFCGIGTVLLACKPLINFGEGILQSDMYWLTA